MSNVIGPRLMSFNNSLILDNKELVPGRPKMTVLALTGSFGHFLFHTCYNADFTTPQITGLTTRLFARCPDTSSGLVQTLVTGSTDRPDRVPTPFRKSAARKGRSHLGLCNCKRPSLDGTGFSARGQIILLRSGMLVPINDFRVCRVPPLPSSFLRARKVHALSVALTFSPPAHPAQNSSCLNIAVRFRLFGGVNPRVVRGTFIDTAGDNAPRDFARVSVSSLGGQRNSKVYIDVFPKSGVHGGKALRGKAIRVGSTEDCSRGPLCLIIYYGHG